MTDEGSGPVGGLTCDEVREMAGSFVLGALAPTEATDVREHLATCPEAHEEIAELGGVLPALAESVPLVEPPAALKDRIMAAAAADLAARRGGPTAARAEPSRPAVGAMEPTPFPSASERAARRSRPATATWLMRIAAVVALVALGGWNLLLQNDLNASKSYEQSVADVLAVAATPGALTAILRPDGGSGAGLAAVSPTGEVRMAMRDLAPTTGNTVYEAWVIGSDGVPIPIGSFTVGSTGTGSLRTTGVRGSNGVLLALTHEPGPGAKTPTVPIISKGVASSEG